MQILYHLSHQGSVIYIIDLQFLLLNKLINILNLLILKTICKRDPETKKL